MAIGDRPKHQLVEFARSRTGVLHQLGELCFRLVALSLLEDLDPGPHTLDRFALDDDLGEENRRIGTAWVARLPVGDLLDDLGLRPALILDGDEGAAGGQVDRPDHHPQVVEQLLVDRVLLPTEFGFDVEGDLRGAAGGHLVGLQRELVAPLLGVLVG